MLVDIFHQLWVGKCLGNSLLRSGDEERAWTGVSRGFAYQLNRRLAEDAGEKCIEPPRNPGRLNLEFHYKNSVRLEQAFGGLKGFDCVHVVVDSNVCVIRTGSVRVQQRENNHVKLLTSVLDIAPRVIVDLAHARGVVRFLVMKFLS